MHATPVAECAPDAPGATTSSACVPGGTLWKVHALSGRSFVTRRCTPATSSTTSICGSQVTHPLCQTPTVCMR